MGTHFVASPPSTDRNHTCLGHDGQRFSVELRFTYVMSALVAVALAVLGAAPALLISAGILSLPVEAQTLCFGLAIVSASFAMSWGAEAAEHDIPRTLALTAVGLLAVLPEYAVDIVFAYKAGENPLFAPYAAANMTGSNRLLLGLGWPMVAIIAWLVRGQRQLKLSRDAVLPLLFLAAATVYSFILPLKASIGLVDTVLLFALFGVYAVFAARAELEEPDLVGPAAVIGALAAYRRRLAVTGLFVFATVVIAASAAPFADGLVQTGRNLGIDDFLLVQWFAPIASEAPEFLLAAQLAARGKASAALALLLVAKLEQWTLLVGSLPLAYAIGTLHLQQVGLALPLDGRQVAEVWLTAAQGTFGVVVLANLALELPEAFTLALLFTAQLVIGSLLRTTVHDPVAADQELTFFSLAYLALSVVFAIRARKAVGALWGRRNREPDPGSVIT
jgi:cation:H+ antiporter